MPSRTVYLNRPLMKILFVCLGNICRSPMAEAVMQHHINARGLDIQVDSAGTGGWHAGESADPRTIAALRPHGISCPSRARQLTSQDFQDFDLILAMDTQNLRDILAWRGAVPSKVRLFADIDVADPYYGGKDGFQHMFQIIENRTIELLDDLQQLRSEQ